jgi:hypothetical protein
LLAQLSFDVANHLIAVGRTEQIRLADQNHRACARLIKRLHCNEIILGKPGACVDQDNPKIAPRKIRDRFLRAGHRERAKPRRINERDAFG